MVSIKTVADGLSRQIEQAIEGKANVEQSDVLCKSVDCLVKLARLQIEMSQIDWNGSDEKPVIEMEKTTNGNKSGDKSKALTASALMDHPGIQSDSNQIPIGLGDRLMAWIYKCQKPFGGREIAVAVGAVGEIEAVLRDLGYWASKGHLEKTGTGALASYRVIDRPYFKPA